MVETMLDTFKTKKVKKSVNLILSKQERPHKNRFYLFRFTIAQGIPVGVLKAGRSFSASWTALILNI